MIYKYCPICGMKLVEKFSWDEGGVPYCPHDDMMFFDVSKPCIVAAIVRDDEVILLKQSYIYENSKVLVSGYVTPGEDLKTAVKREVKEETGIIVDNPMFLGSYYVEKKEIIMLAFVCRFISGDIVKSDEVEGIGWVKINEAIDEMKEDKIGTDIMNKIIDLKDRWDNSEFKYITDIQNL